MAMVEKGFVYVLTNPAMPGIVKVGKTARVPDKRILDSDLTSTGVPTPFVVEYYAFFQEMGRAERRAHEKLGQFHFGKEFFRVDKALAIIAIESVGLSFTRLFLRQEEGGKARELICNEEYQNSNESYSQPKAKLSVERDYLIALQTAIARQQKYPSEAREKKQAGTVIVSFIVLEDGRIHQCHISKTSGFSDLDLAAIAAIQKLGCFDPIPKEIDRRSWLLHVPIRFACNGNKTA